ncbi:MAG: tRNA glutamyl-Q(34) synthetase GluQRS [Microthrixaceae bacterium]
MTDPLSPAGDRVGCSTTGRFAPSPTGRLHLGNLRTAIIAWLWTRSEGGRFLVRMEDLDRVTSRRHFEVEQLRELAALGLDWDGDVVRQSDRFDRHHQVIDDLTDKGLTYPCYCSRREIVEAASAPHGSPGRYPGTCRDLDRSGRRRRSSSGRPPALRFRSTAEPVAVVDEVLGPLVGTPDDVVVRRGDGVPSYHLAVVVDDADQGVDLVVRGDDLAPATPSQVALGVASGLAIPRYGHVPVLRNIRGERLAKRDGAVTLEEQTALGRSTVEVLAQLLRSCRILRPDHLDATTLDSFGTTAAGRLLDAALGDFDPRVVRDASTIWPWTFTDDVVPPRGK